MSITKNYFRDRHFASNFFLLQYGGSFFLCVCVCNGRTWTVHSLLTTVPVSFLISRTHLSMMPPCSTTDPLILNGQTTWRWKLCRNTVILMEIIPSWFEKSIVIYIYIYYRQRQKFYCVQQCMLHVSECQAWYNIIPKENFLFLGLKS